MKSNDRGGDAKRRRKDDAPVIDDPRFAGLHSDPRFQKLPKSRLRLPLDPRFQRMFTDKAFVDPFSLDKRGRPVKKKEKKKHTLERYYRIDDAAAGAATPAPEEGLEDKDEDVDEKEDGVEKNAGLKEVSNSSDDEASDSSSSESSSSDADGSGEEEEEEEVATTDKETRRLAVVNMDWSCIKALDLLMVFNSFLPKGGSIVSVAVYPSQYGLEQMKKEDVHGPTLFDTKQDDDQEDELDMEKLRAYEKSKLRYYFAVVTCDSVSTASALYTACDGIEFERTSNILDLQFVPDDREFAVEPRDVASQVVEGYEAPDFQTAALQLSNVKLTWDDDEPVRAKSLRKKFDPNELKEMDFKAYLASEDEDEEDGAGESRREKFRSLLLDNPDETLDSKKKDVDMEITFPSGLEELNKKYLERNKKNRDEKEETVWEAQLRRKKEKRKKKEKHDESDEKQAVAADEDGFNDPFFDSDPAGGADGDSESEDERVVAARPTKVDKDERKKKREERELKKKEDERRKAELELLLLDENGGNGGVKGYNLKKGKKKSKFKAKDSDAKNEELLAKTDFNDPRFSALLNSHHFAIDPTDPQFKRSATKLRAIAEMQQKRFQGQAPRDEPKPRERKEKLELSSLVRSLKRKAGGT